MIEKAVVASDLHGYHQPLEKMLRHYGDSPDRYLLNGDLIGQGQSTARVMDIAQKIDADITLGNWELFLLAGMLHTAPEVRNIIQATTRVFDENVLNAIAQSYGIPAGRTHRSEKTDRLKEAMLEKGHLQMLVKAAMYFEGQDFVVVHAGLTDANFSLQQQELSCARKDLLDNTGDEEFNEPLQITSLPLAHQPEAFAATRKIVVTGHAHTPRGNRITAGGARVRLGSQLDLGAPLHVWQSWDGQIKSFDQQ